MGMCFHILTETVYNRFHKAVIAQDFHLARFAFVHHKDSLAVVADVVILWSGMIGHRRQFRLIHPIHTELDDLTVFLRPSEYVIAVVVPYQVVWREAIEVAVEQGTGKIKQIIAANSLIGAN